MTEQIGFEFVVEAKDAAGTIRRVEAQVRELEKQLNALSATNNKLVSSNKALTASYDKLQSDKRKAAEASKALAAAQRAERTAAATAEKEAAAASRALASRQRQERADAELAISSKSRLRQSFTELNQGIELAQKGYHLFNSTLGASMRHAMAYEKGLAEISTIARGSSFDLVELDRAAREMSSRFGTLPVEQTSAFYEAISSGATSSSDSVHLLDAANKLAIGGLSDVKTSVDGLTSVLNAYNLKGSDSTKVTDAMFVAVEKGKIKTAELSRTFGVLAPIANQVGNSFQAAMAAVAAITAGGIQGETAIRGYRQALVNVIKPTQQATDLAAALGLNFSASALKAKGFPAFLQDVIDKTGGSSLALSTLFSDVDGFAVISALASQGGMAQFKSALEAMEKSSGRTAQAFGIMANTTDAAIKRMEGSFTRLATVIGGALDIRGVADEWAKEFANLSLIMEREGFGAAVVSQVTADTTERAWRIRQSDKLRVADDLARRPDVAGMGGDMSFFTPDNAELGTINKVSQLEVDIIARREKEKKERVKRARVRQTKFDAGFGLGSGLTDFYSYQTELNQKTQDTVNRASTIELEQQQRALMKSRPVKGGLDDPRFTERQFSIAEAENKAFEGIKQKADAMGMAISNALVSGVLHAKNFGDAVGNIFKQLAVQASTALLGKGIGAGLKAIPGIGTVASLLGFSQGGMVPSFAGGGLVGGRFSISGPDDRLATVRTGELIIPPDTTRSLARLFGKPTSSSFAAGGVVGPAAAGIGGSVYPITIIHQSMGEVSRQDADRMANRRIEPSFQRNARNRMKTHVFNRTPGRR